MGRTKIVSGKLIIQHVQDGMMLFAPWTTMEMDMGNNMLCVKYPVLDLICKLKCCKSENIFLIGQSYNLDIKLVVLLLCLYHLDQEMRLGIK